MLSKKKAIKRTRKMWRELARTGGTSKHDVLQKFWPGKQVTDNCWACQYDAEHTEGYDTHAYSAGDCSNCPVWTGGSTCLEDPKGSGKPGLYNRWVDAKSEAVAKKYAQAIVDLCDEQLRLLK